MFTDELTPVFRELTRAPIAFLGGFVTGLLRLNLADEPVRGWLDRQTGTYAPVDMMSDHHNGKGQGPQSISID